ncbi:DUF6233 domain-containing protein [Streptomyces echinatus]|uniref:DUF6233 domain-containing protein n=1 Tax=Streptomyces echinatus TaxID=67293 RepID=UPI0037B924C3
MFEFLSKLDTARTRSEDRSEMVAEQGPMSRLDALRFTRRVVEQHTARQLDLIDRWIADEERRQAERQRGEQARPPAPQWLLEPGLNKESPPVYVHAGGCWNAGRRSRGVDQDAALRTLADGVPPCPHCQPDKALGHPSRPR